MPTIFFFLLPSFTIFHRSCSSDRYTPQPSHRSALPQWGPVIGQVMAELLVDGTQHPALAGGRGAFDPSRFLGYAEKGTRGRKMRDQSVGEQW